MDFGESQSFGRPVALDIAQRLPATMELTVTALLLACVIGVPLGVVAAVNHNRWPDFLLRVFSIGGVAIAAFWFAIMLQLLFAMQLHWLPLRGRLSDGLTPPGGHRIPPGGQPPCRPLRYLPRCLAHLALPAITLSLGAMATITRFTRAGVLETMQKEFVAL